MRGGAWPSWSQDKNPSAVRAVRNMVMQRGPAPLVTLYAHTVVYTTNTMNALSEDTDITISVAIATMWVINTGGMGHMMTDAPCSENILIFGS